MPHRRAPLQAIRASAVCRLLAGLASLAILLLPMDGQAADQPVTIAPFQLIGNTPDCAGYGESAYRVVFEERQAKVRFGISGERAVTSCTIKTRRGAQITEIAIPCADDKVARAAGPQPAKSADSVAGTADISGEVTGCHGLASHRFLKARWRIQGSSPLGPFVLSGALDTPGLGLLFQGIRTGVPFGGLATYLARPSTLALFFDQVSVPLRQGQDQKLDLSAYAVVAPSPIEIYSCFADRDCRTSPASAGQFMGKDFAGGLVSFVDGD